MSLNNSKNIKLKNNSNSLQKNGVINKNNNNLIRKDIDNNILKNINNINTMNEDQIKFWYNKLINNNRNIITMKHELLLLSMKEHNPEQIKDNNLTKSNIYKSCNEVLNK